MDTPTLNDLLLPLSVLDRANIAGVLGGVSNTRPHDFRTAFMTASVGVEASDLQLSRLYRLLAIAFEPALRPSQTREPFSPLATYADGTRTFLPRDLAPGHMELLHGSMQEGLSPAFNARLADILWVCRFKGLLGTREYAALAVRYYLADAQQKQAGSDWAYAPKSLERAMRLAFQIDRPPGHGPSKDTRDAALLLADAFEADEQWMGVSATLRLLHEFGAMPPSHIAERCERCAISAEAGTFQIIAEHLWQQAVTSWRAAGDVRRSELAILQAAELEVRQAVARAPQSAGVATHFLHAAIKQLRLLPTDMRREREAELQAMLAEQQARSVGELKTISSTFDGTRLWAHGEAATTGKTFFDALRSLVLCNRAQDVEVLRRQVIENSQKFILSHLAGVELKGEGGKTIKRIPGMNLDETKENGAAIQYRMVQQANLHQNMLGVTFIEAARRVIVVEHALEVSNFMDLMHQSGFVPAGREWQWALAFAAAFDGDFTTATHLFIPQLEHALRMLHRGAGGLATSMDRLGQQEDWNLNHLLLGEGRPATEAILGVDVTFDLAALLVDRGGANLRNMVSHGLINDLGLESGLPRYLCWACLQLCLIPMIYATEAEADEDPAPAAPDGET